MKWIGLLLASLITLQLSAQDLEKSFEKYSTQYSREKIYFHYDKSAYAPGETVWFKGYVMKELFPSNDTKTIYTDISDEKGNLILRLTTPVVQSGAIGQFEIPDNYAGKFIHIKAYTKWMLNFDSAFLYNKDIKILPVDKKQFKEKIEYKPELNFFPEGGNFIINVANKVAFKANDQFGNPIKVSGSIENQIGKVVGKINPIHDGMGFVMITPKAGETYTAKWIDEQKKTHTSNLPKPSEGVTLQITGESSKRKFELLSSEATRTDMAYIVGTMYGQIVFKIQNTFANGKIEGLIPTKDLPSGILTITAFDHLSRPTSERIIFINNHEYTFSPDVEVMHWGINKRAKNEVEISVPADIVANLSVSVTDYEIAHDTSENIITNLLLTSDLKGRVNNPWYYFQNNEVSLSNDLDLVMLTHGWRRYNWQGIVSGELPKINYQKDASYLSLSGKIYGLTPTELKKAGHIILVVNKTGKNNEFLTAELQADGSFMEQTYLLYDTAKVYYEFPTLNTTTKPSVQFMQNKLPASSTNTLANGLFYNYNADTTGTSRQTHYSDLVFQEQKLEKVKVLDEVVIKRKTKPPVDILDEQLTSGLFRGGDAYQFDIGSDPLAAGSLDIFAYLSGKVPGLQIAGNPPTVKFRNATPSFFINEVPADMDLVSTLTLGDIAYVKVIKPPFIGSSGGTNGGAIAIYMKKGSQPKGAPGEGLASNTVVGYSSVKEFYSPNYSNIQPENDKKDYRTTLYWNPEIITQPGQNKVLLTFYNNDISNGFRIVIEGISADGKMTHVEKIME